MMVALLVLGGVGGSSLSVTDPRDGETYAVVRLGRLHWLAEDLRYAAAGSVCYDFAQDRCALGRLYGFEDARRSCPAGWRLPSDPDWKTLERAIGMDDKEIEAESARGDKGDRLKLGGDTGFSARFVGYLDPHRNEFRRAGETAAYWTSTLDGADDVSATAWHRDLNVSRSGIYRSKVNVTYKLAVRCVADDQRIDRRPVDTRRPLP